MQRPQLGHNTSPSKNPRCPNKFRNTQRLRPARFSNAPARPAHPQRTVAAFSAAKGLIFKGVKQPSGYTEPLLHAWRLREKAGRAR